VCIALFVAGLVVYLRRDPDPPVTGSATSDTVLVRKRDGTPWFLVDARPDQCRGVSPGVR